ncbi:hypothetical protein [Aliihoeflea sp. 2WW]|uniref:hypothetical protein n=1 Tax=Aliihoeflea sp. 2WW TaxID=1381123 RepID=UPI0004B9BAC3|nr:hypothetical protein [Aliihoeflea sp. 2WW]
MASRQAKIAVAMDYIGEQLSLMIERNYDESGNAFHTQGTFTAMLEAYRACEIAAAYEERIEEEARRNSYSSSLAKNLD